MDKQIYMYMHVEWNYNEKKKELCVYANTMHDLINLHSGTIHNNIIISM